MTDVSIRRVEKKKIDQETDDKIAEGWKLKSRTNDLVVLEKQGNYGSLISHVVVFVLTVWWTFFIGNILWAVYKHYTTGQELRLKAE